MKIETTECGYQATECDLKYGEQITLDGELLIPASVLDKIKAEIESIEHYATKNNHDLWIRTPDEIKKDVLDIIDKYKTESGK